MVDARRLARRAEVGAQSRTAVQTAEDGAQRHLLEFARRGPARYLSHLDTARAVQRTFARAGVEVALTQGMRPKPRLALGLPLPVGAAGLSELAVVDLLTSGGSTQVADAVAALRASAPPGLEIASLAVCGRHQRLRARLAVYEWRVDVAVALLKAAVGRFVSSTSVPYVRQSPKGRRTLDLRRFIDTVELEPLNGDAGLRFAVRHLTDGAARPAELLGQLLEWSGSEDLDGVSRLVAPGAPIGEEADECADGATVDSVGMVADGRPARVVNAALTRLGVVYDGLAARGPAQEWLERHAIETQKEGEPAGQSGSGGRGD